MTAATFVQRRGTELECPSVGSVSHTAVVETKLASTLLGLQIAIQLDSAVWPIEISDPHSIREQVIWVKD